MPLISFDARYGHVLRKDDDDWVKKCMEHEVEGSRPRGRPKKTWKEVVRYDCQARKLNKEDAMDRCKWRKIIKEARWSGWVWVGECLFRYRPTRVVPDQRPLNGRCCCCWLLNSTTGLDWGFCSGGISDLVYVEDFTVISGTMAHTAEYVMSHKQILLLDF